MEELVSIFDPLTEVFFLLLAGLFLVLWIITFYLFFRYRKRVRRKLHKMIGLVTIKNSHEIKVLKESLEKYRSMAEQINEGLLLTDAENRIVFANKCACEQLKQEEQNILGTVLTDYAIGTNDSSRLRSLLKKMTPGRYTRDEFMLKRGEKDFFHASLSLTHPKVPSSLKNSNIIVMVDITEKVLLEKKMRKLTDNLVQKVRQLNCVFEIQQVLSEPGQSKDRILQKALRVIPHGLRYEQDMRVEIFYDGKRFASSGFRETQWLYKVPLKNKNGNFGHIAVSYVGASPPRHQQLFRIGEKSLLKNLADKLMKGLDAL